MLYRRVILCLITRWAESGKTEAEWDKDLADRHDEAVKFHEQLIMLAIGDGETIPDKVLADYPHLTGLALKTDEELATTSNDLMGKAIKDKLRNAEIDKITKPYETEMIRRAELAGDRHRWPIYGSKWAAKVEAQRDKIIAEHPEVMKPPKEEINKQRKAKKAKKPVILTKKKKGRPEKQSRD